MPDTRPLVITDDEDLLDDLLRLAAISGTEVDVAPDVVGARSLWRSARVVLVGSDAAMRLGRRPPVRRGVILVGRDLDDAGVWELGVYAGAEHVAVLPDAESWLTDVLATAADRRAEPAPMVAVIGGRGGAGATSLAIAVAVAGVRAGLDTMLVDADPLGGGMDLALGGEGASGLRWDAFCSARGRLPSSAVSGALPRIDGLTVLTWDRAASGPVPVEAVEAAMEAGRRGQDLVVADLPRTLGKAELAIAEQASVVILLVPAELRAAAAAAQVRAQLLGCADVQLVVRGPAPGGLDGWLISDALGLPLLANLRPEPGLTTAYERGDVPGTRGRGPLAKLADRIVDEFAVTVAAAARSAA
ncbi:MAG: septum site-determining protein minD [Frankiales bacterium]|nr:septum site-determining protein minD [Frankiales bacterium]